MEEKKVVLITGVTGMDGSNMTDYLLENTDYEIYGGIRRLSVSNHKNISKALANPRFHLVDFDLGDTVSINEAIEKTKPDFILNLAVRYKFWSTNHIEGSKFCWYIMDRTRTIFRCQFTWSNAYIRSCTKICSEM